MLRTAEFWVLVAFVIFTGVMLYIGVHSKIAALLDERARKIAEELAEATRLREDAARLFAEYEARRREAEKDAEDIVAAARRDAERLAADAKARAEDFVARRTRMAESKIAQAESQALAEVRAVAADAAVRAAERILAAEMKGPAGEAQLAAGIRDVKAKLH